MYWAVVGFGRLSGEYEYFDPRTYDMMRPLAVFCSPELPLSVSTILLSAWRGSISTPKDSDPVVLDE